MPKRLFAVSFLLAWFVFGCGDECINTHLQKPLLPPAADEYRLLFTNLSGQLVELTVDGKSVGVFCPQVKNLYIGNFKRNKCSQITARFFDLDRTKKLDDCAYLGYPICIDNNTSGRVCFDTTGSLIEVKAEIK